MSSFSVPFFVYGGFVSFSKLGFLTGNEDTWTDLSLSLEGCLVVSLCLVTELSVRGAWGWSGAWVDNRRGGWLECWTGGREEEIIVGWVEEWNWAWVLGIGVSVDDVWGARVEEWVCNWAKEWTEGCGEWIIGGCAEWTGATGKDCTGGRVDESSGCCCSCRWCCGP